MSVLTDILGTATKQAAASVTSDPQVKAALKTAQDDAAFAKKVAIIVGIAGTLVFFFYYVPRFEVPKIPQLPRIRLPFRANGRRKRRN